MGSFFGKYKLENSSLFCNKTKNQRQIVLIFLFIFFLFIDFLISISSHFIDGFSGVFVNYVRDILFQSSRYYSIPLIIIKSILFLFIFETIEIKNERLSKIITKFSSFMFGVYLVHDNYFVCKFLYKSLPFGVEGNLYGYSTIIRILIYSLVIFVISLLIEFIRQVIFNLVYKTKINKRISNKLYSYYDSIEIKN